MSNSVLITGGLGYIGSRLARELVRAGSDVRLGTRDICQPIPDALVGCRLVPMDFSSPASLRDACAGVRQIVHLAAMNDAACSEDPEAAFDVNVLGTLRLIDAARLGGADRILYASTAHVYCSPLAGVLSEETPPHPAHIYGITHKAAEDLVLAEDAKGQLTGIVLRLANGFGAPLLPRAECWRLLVNDLCRQAVTRGELTLKSTGSQERNFITLTDVIRAIDYFLRMPALQTAGRVFNIGGRTSMTVLAMTQLVADCCEHVLGFRPEISRATGTDTSSPLHFSVARAQAAGFEPDDNYANEIDACLQFCRAVDEVSN